MSISDPAQLLQRVPELEALTGDARIRRAIESGDPFKVYRTLVLARLFRRLPGQKDLLKALTGERRLFAKALKGTPSLLSFNSVGFGFVGKAEKNADDSYIALHALVVLFAVPVIPLGAFVVRETGSRQYQIYARAPLGILGWLYTRGVALALVLSVLVGAAHSFRAAGTQELTVLNGFTVPLTVTIGGQQITVAPNSHSALTLNVGQLTGTARTAKGEVLDTLTTDLHSSGRLSIWNVAGAAPLARNTIVYSKQPGAGQNAQQIYCGARFVELANIKYAFQPPPETVSMGKHTDSTTVEQVEILKAPASGAANACLAYSLDKGHEKDVAPLAEALAQLDGWSYNYTSLALFTASLVSPAEALRVAQRAASAQPKDVLIARLLQTLREQAGDHEALVREHAARAQGQPDSALEQYLSASLISGKAGIAAFETLSAKFPADGPILRSLAWRRTAHGDYDGALRDLARLHKVSQSDADLVADVEVRALAGAHRAPAALALLEHDLANPEFSARGESILDFALLARQLGADPERYLKPAGPDEDNPRALDVMRVRAGLPLLQADHHDDPRVKITLALRESPAQAISQVGALSLGHLMGMSNMQRALLYGEAVRKGDAATSARLAGALHLARGDDASLREFLRGGAGSIDALDLDLDVQAAMYFIRSRNPQLPADERNGLRQRAAQLDVLHADVSTALKQWPAEGTI